LTLNDIPLVTIDGETTSLAPYADKVKLIVNVASRCGLTPQYTKLEELELCVLRGETTAGGDVDDELDLVGVRGERGRLAVDGHERYVVQRQGQAVVEGHANTQRCDRRD